MDRWRHLPGLDGLRGVAILLVVVGHVGFRQDSFGGPVGVTLFFVLSGYLITSLLLREQEEQGRIRLTAFYARRGLRLLPALALYLLLTPAILYLIKDPGLHSQFLQVVPFVAIYAMNFIQAIGANLVLLSHPWSLSLEEQFYLLWPAILIGLLWLTRKRPRALVWSIAGLAACALTWHVQGSVRYDFLRAYFAPDTSAFALIAGSLLAVLPRSTRWAGGPKTVLVLLAGLIGLSCLLRVSIWNGDLSLWVMVPTVALAMLLIRSTDRVSVLDSRIIVWFGQISYSLYLWHFTLMELRPYGNHLSIAQRGGMAAVAVVFAAVSRQLVELPALGLKSRLAGVPTAEPVATAVLAPRRRLASPRLSTAMAGIGALALVLPTTGLVLRVSRPHTVPAAVAKFQVAKAAQTKRLADAKRTAPRRSRAAVQWSRSPALRSLRTHRPIPGMSPRQRASSRPSSPASPQPAARSRELRTRST